MKKIIITFIVSLMLTSSGNAGTDGTKSIDKDKNYQKSKVVKDCFEGINRATFAFNQGLDKIIFEPIARVYRHLPRPIRSGAGNVVNNLSNLVTIPNNILQGSLKIAGVNTARFAINSTVGFLGFFDVASSLGFSDYIKEDYGQTLGTMGVGPGCYVVLPVIGPSTIRDTLGSLVNLTGGDAWYNVTVRNDTQYLTDVDYYTSRLTTGIDFRAKNLDAFENIEQNSMDFYASVRSLYLQDREQKIINSKHIVQTQDDSDWEELETN